MLASPFTRNLAGFGGALALAGAGAMIFYGSSALGDARYVKLGKGIGFFLVTAGGALALQAALKAPEAAAESGGLVGLASRTVFGSPDPGVESVDSTTSPASALGKPKNVKGLVGKFLEPTEGGRISRDLLSDTYTVRVAIASVGESEVRAPIEITIYEDATIGAAEYAREVSEPRTVSPGAAQKIYNVRVPIALSKWNPQNPKATARLYVAGYLLDKITFNRE